MPYERADAITIRYVDYSETSRVFTFYTREFGRIPALAKGVKRKYSKLIGHVDLLSHCEIVFVSGAARERLNILTEASAAESFPGIRAQLPRYYAACHAAELIYRMTAEEDPNDELFERFLRLLRRLDQGADPALALFAFEGHLLMLCGFMPQLTACVSCGKPIREKKVAFATVRGGVVCSACSPGEAHLIENIPAGALSLFDRLARDRLTRLDRVTVSHQAAKQVRAFLNQYESQVLNRELETAKHL